MIWSCFKALVQTIFKLAFKMSFPHNMILNKKELGMEFKKSIIINAKFRDTNEIRSNKRTMKNFL